MSRRLRLCKFKDLNLADPFFDSLKAGYEEFPVWFAKKLNENVFVVDDGDKLSGFIYLKPEHGSVDDVVPPLPKAKWIKVGTLKIVAQGTTLGERIIKKILDFAISEKADGVYVTVFEIHKSLIELFERYGFARHATKTTVNGTEIVLARLFSQLTGDLRADYPFIHTKGQASWLLAIYPKYHSQLLPDSILNNEPQSIIEDVSHTNTIHKMYTSGLFLNRMKRGDIVIFYRTSDGKGLARFRSVATSVCMVEEVKTRKDFINVDAYLAYALKGSVFTEEELRHQYNTWSRLYVAKLTYNAAFQKRLTRGLLMDDVGIPEQPRWDLKPITRDQLFRMLELGGVDARLIVD